MASESPKNLYQQSQKSTQITGAFTFFNNKDNSQLSHNIVAQKTGAVNKSQQNKQPIQLYKQDSQSSDPPVNATKFITPRQQLLNINNESSIQNSMPKKLSIINNYGKQQRQLGQNKKLLHKHKKYGSIESIQQQKQQQNGQIQAQHDQIRKFIKKADQLNYQNYRRLQIDSRTMPIFNTNSNINIYKSSKNILDQIGGGQQSAQKRIRQIYLRNNGITNSNNTNNGIKKNIGKFNRTNKSISYQHNNTYNSNSKNQSNKNVGRKLQQKQSQYTIQAKQTKQVQTQTEIYKDTVIIRAGRYTSLEAIEQDTDYQPAIPKKIKSNNFNQQRNNRLLSQTISILNNQEPNTNISNKQREKMDVSDILRNNRTTTGSKNVTYTEQYLNNLSKTQHQFLNSVRNQKRTTLSAFNNKRQDNIYQTTVFNTNYQTQDSFLPNSKKSMVNNSYEFSNANAVNNKNKPVLQPIANLRNTNLWENVGVEEPESAKVYHNKVNKEAINKKNNEAYQKQEIKMKTVRQNKHNEKEIKLSAHNNVETLTKNAEKESENSLEVQQNYSDHGQSNSPSQLNRNISKVSKNNGYGNKINAHYNNNSRQIVNPNIQHKNNANNKKPMKNSRNSYAQTPVMAFYDAQQSPLYNTRYYQQQMQQVQAHDTHMHNQDINSHEVLRAQKSIQAPQITQIRVGENNTGTYKPTHPITTSLNQKQRDWITKEYQNKVATANKMNSNQNKGKIDPSTLLIKKYRNGVYYGQLSNNISSVDINLDSEQQRKDGYGTIFYYNGKTYQGYFINNLKHGKGTQFMPDGSYYEGQFQDGLKSGKGRYEWGSGKEIYQGQWANGKKNGSGMWKRYNDKNSNKYDMYIGEWKNGKIEGFGVLTVIDGHRYEGQFKNSQKWGLGTQRYSNGDTYVGQFRKNRPNGVGQYYWSTGGYYKGDFSNGLKHGKGHYKGVRASKQDQQNIQKQPKKSEGVEKIKNNNILKNKKTNNKKPKTKLSPPKKKQKSVTIVEPDQQKMEQVEYTGQFRNDKQCGFGEQTIKQSDGTTYIYRGNFENDLRHGYGQIAEQSKFTIRGYWINGTKVGQQMGVIAEDQMQRVESLPQYKNKRKKTITRKEAVVENGHRSISKLQKSVSPNRSPRVSIQKQYSPDDPNFKRQCGCNRKH